MKSMIFYLIISLVCCVLTCSNTFAAMSKSIKKKILICGVCKNVSSYIDNTIKNIESLGSNFEDYKVIIYENNSTDNTAKRFTDWSKQNDRVIFISENLNEQQLMAVTRPGFFGKPSRMELIARARNIVLSIARDKKYNDFKYLLMADLDFRHPWPIEEILNTIQSKRDWDCVLANGLSAHNTYYDRFAFRNAEFPFGPELLGTYFWDEIAKTRFRFPETNDWLPVYSAFGGLGIYKRKAIIPFSYIGYAADHLKTDYMKIFRSLPSNSSHRNKYLEIIGKPSDSSPFSIPILFQCNSWHNSYPVCCEHVTIHASMRLNGFKNIFINPRMIMQYDCDY